MRAGQADKSPKTTAIVSRVLRANAAREFLRMVEIYNISVQEEEEAVGDISLSR